VEDEQQEWDSSGPFIRELSMGAGQLGNESDWHDWYDDLYENFMLEMRKNTLGTSNWPRCVLGSMVCILVCAQAMRLQQPVAKLLKMSSIFNNQLRYPLPKSPLVTRFKCNQTKNVSSASHLFTTVPFFDCSSSPPRLDSAIIPSGNVLPTRDQSLLCGLGLGLQSALACCSALVVDEYRQRAAHGQCDGEQDQVDWCGVAVEDFVGHGVEC
jgi:hypothetical protein